MLLAGLHYMQVLKSLHVSYLLPSPTYLLIRWRYVNPTDHLSLSASRRKIWIDLTGSQTCSADCRHLSLNMIELYQLCTRLAPMSQRSNNCPLLTIAVQPKLAWLKSISTFPLSCGALPLIQASFRLTTPFTEVTGQTMFQSKKLVWF